MGGGFRRLRIALPLTLLVMILMRLIWMQLRSYPVALEGRAVQSLAYLETQVDEACSYDPALPWVEPEDQSPVGREARAWLLSPGYAVFGYVGCLAGVAEDRPIVRLNQWLLAATALLAVVMTRFATSSWTVALIVGAMLMSRGRLLTDIGQVSVDFPAMLVVTAWLAAQTHFVRTAAWASLAGAVLAALAGVLVDRSLIGLALATPVMLGVGYLFRRRLARPVIARLRGARRRRDQLAMVAAPPISRSTPQALALPREAVSTAFGRVVGSVRWLLGMEFGEEAGRPPLRPTDERGTLLRTLATPFLLWVYARRRWLRLSIGWLGVAMLAGVAALLAYRILGGPQAFDLLRTTSPAMAQTLSELAESWRLGLLDRFDVHLTVSLFVVLYCAAQSPAAGLAGFLETTWLALLAAALVSLGAFAADAFDLGLAARLGATAAGGLGAPLLARPVALWFEPVVLSLGAAGIYNLMKVLDTLIAEKT